MYCNIICNYFLILFVYNSGSLNETYILYTAEYRHNYRLDSNSSGSAGGGGYSGSGDCGSGNGNGNGGSSSSKSRST